MAWVTGASPARGPPFRAVQAYPAGDTAPEIWMLGSSDYGAQVAAHFGLPYAFAWFFTEGAGARAGARHLPQPLQAEPAPSRAARGAVRVGAGGRDRGGGAAPLHARAPASACCATAASSPPLEPPEAAAAHTYTPMPRGAHRRVPPAAHSSAAARRSPSASTSSPSASTSRRWPSSPGPTTRPRATRATACSPRRWARLQRTPSHDPQLRTRAEPVEAQAGSPFDKLRAWDHLLLSQPTDFRSGSSTRASGRVHQPGCSIPARRPPAAPAPCAGS